MAKSNDVDPGFFITYQSVVDYLREYLIATYGPDARKWPVYLAILSSLASQILRYSRMRKGYCFADLDSIAEGIGATREPVQKGLPILESSGLIDCIFRSPGGRNNPSHYQPTETFLDLLPPTEQERIRAGIYDNPDFWGDAKPAVGPRVIENDFS